MEFRLDRNQILCLRDPEAAPVCSFDAQLDRVPPHVEATLVPAERDALEAWLADRATVRRKSPEQLLIDSLPGLLDAGAAALAEDAEIDRASLQRLRFSLRRLSGMLRTQRPKPAPSEEAPVQMSEDEYLSHQLRELSENIAA